MSEQTFGYQGNFAGGKMFSQKIQITSGKAARKGKILFCNSEYTQWKWKLNACLCGFSYCSLLCNSQLGAAVTGKVSTSSLTIQQRGLNWVTLDGYVFVCRQTQEREAKLKEQFQAAESPAALLGCNQSSPHVQRWYHHLKCSVSNSAVYLWHIIKHYRKITIHK